MDRENVTLFHRIRRPLAVLVLALMAPACGKGGSNSASAPSGPPPSFAVVPTTPAGSQSGLVSISYSLIDASGSTCSIAVQFSTDAGATFQPATGGPGGDGVRDLASSPSPGTAHVFQWNSLADGVGVGGASTNVVVRITASEAASAPPAGTSGFTVDNSSHSPPTAAITTPVGTQGGLVSIGYTLTDSESDPCTLTALFSTNGGTSYSPATAGPGGAVADLSSGPGGGVSHTFVWNSVADGVASGGANATVRFRLIPSDGEVGSPATTPNFTVDNSSRPSGSSIGGSFPIRQNPTGASDWGTAIATDGSALFVFGFEGFDVTAPSGADSSWRLQKRLLPGGGLDAGFGAAGSVAENPGAGLDLPFKVLVDGGSVYLIGAQESALNSRSFTLRIEKRKASDGTLVASFGSGGVLAGPAVASQDGIPLPWSAAVDGSFLILAGTATESGSDLKWRIEKRDRTTGSLVPAFGTAGVLEENPTGLVDGCFAVTIDATSMWLAGAQGVDGAVASNGQIRLEKRALVDGSLVAAFGTGGIVTADPSAGDDLAEDLASDGAALYVYARVETSFNSGVFKARIEKRSLVDGSLSLPAVTGSPADPTGALPCGHLVIDGAFLFVTGADNAADCQWRIEKRMRSDLSLAAGFGAAGVVTSNPTPGAGDRPLGAAATGGVLYVLGMDSLSGDEGWRVEARWR